MVSVLNGGYQTFTMIPDAGYVISEVDVDGRKIRSGSRNTFSDGTTNHTINARFSTSTGQHAINAIADPWTIYYPGRNRTYPTGSNQTQISQATPGVELKNVTVDNSSQGAVSSLTFTNIILDHEIFVRRYPDSRIGACILQCLP